jgi:hypothetical protein
MGRSLRVAVVLSSAVAAAASLHPSAQARDSGPKTGRIVVVQALPGVAVNVAVDGKVVDRQAKVGAVLGPYSLAPGKHQVRFTDSSGDVRLATSVEVASGSSSDVVVHRPAAVAGQPVVNSYRTPQGPIGPGKARVLIAHTATVAPADVRVDGKVVFRDIANGEYATADVPAGTHRVALLPTGLANPPILGPLTLTLAPGTVTNVYAVGDPKQGSMNVILHRAVLASNGAAAPETIDTGMVGLAAHAVVRPFGRPYPVAIPVARSTFPWAAW